MQRTMYSTAILAGLGLLTLSPTVQACGYGMPSPVARFALADSVVVGTVTEVLDRTVSARPYALAQLPVPFTVVVVKVDETLKGDDRLTHLHLGLHVHQVMQPGYKGLFFLSEHAEEPFFTLSSRLYDYPIGEANNPGFAAQVKTYRHLGQLLANPQQGLTAKEQNDRFLTAAMLIAQYRTFNRALHAVPAKMNPIDAETSRLILTVLAEIDWKAHAADFRLMPQRLFNQLGITVQHGWNPANIQKAEDFEPLARQWLRDNRETFRIQTFVSR